MRHRTRREKREQQAEEFDLQKVHSYYRTEN
jgi:hypothetical protein